MMKKGKKQFRAKMKQAGFTLLFASLIGSLVIAVGLAILDITLKQLTLASAGRESQQAFYSADAGTECALYLDRGAGFSDCRLGFFGTPSTTAQGGMSVCGVAYSASAPHMNAPDDIQCFGRRIDITRIQHLNSIENTFYLSDDPLSPAANGSDSTNDNMCFEVSVLKTIDTAQNAVASGTTIIESRGYNTCDVDTPNRFERAIRTVNN
jgi:hypothetical protein